MRRHLRAKTANRQASGSTMAELPVVLWVLFVLIAFPLMDLACAFLRISFLYAGVHYASISAARTGSFSIPLDGHPSAQGEVLTKLGNITSGFSGLAVTNINTDIVIIRNDTMAVSKQAVPLTSPADQGINTYQIEVTADCSADPLVPIPIPVTVSGLNAPLTVRLSAKQYCENPQGLTL